MEPSRLRKKPLRKCRKAFISSEQEHGINLAIISFSCASGSAPLSPLACGYLSEPYRPYGPHDDAIDELLTALLNTEEIGLRYAASTERTWERLHPLALVMYRRALYLLARFPGQDKVFRLAVDRIVEVTRLKVPFVYPPDFDVASELSSSFGIAETGEAIEEVRLRFAPRVARLVRSRVWHPSQTFVDLDNGGVELRFPGSGRELVRLALEFGETVEVVGPAWLREAVRDELANALAHYT